MGKKMNKKEIRNQIANLISSGVKKHEVFTQLSGQGVSDSRLAYMVAAYPNPQRVADSKIWVRILLFISGLQVLLGFIVGFGIGIHSNLNAGLFLGTLISLFMLLFFLGFYKNKVAAYNVTIILSITQFSHLLKGFESSPNTTIFAILINIALVGYVAFVRHKLFPDFILMTPRKVNGSYVFSDGSPKKVWTP